MSEIQRKYLPTFSELIDRLSIIQIKELTTKEYKKEYSKEISEIMYDIDMLISSKGLEFDANTLRAIIVLSQTNFNILNNEYNVKKGSRGIGKAIAALFASEGAKLAICARNGESLNRVADELRAGGTEVLAQTCDVSCESDVERFFECPLCGPARVERLRQMNLSQQILPAISCSCA